MVRQIYGIGAALLATLLVANPAGAAVGTARTGVYLLPMTCAELLPNMGPYLNFFEAVGRGNVATDRQFARRIFRILSLRDKLVEEADRAREQNPVDVLIRKTLCFYREQREPLKAISYDDERFVAFLKTSLKELENHVDDAIFSFEFERAQRLEYQRELERYQTVVERVREQADLDADRNFEKIAGAAKRKVRQQ